MCSTLPVCAALKTVRRLHPNALTRPRRGPARYEPSSQSACQYRMEKMCGLRVGIVRGNCKGALGECLEGWVDRVEGGFIDSEY